MVGTVMWGAKYFTETGGPDLSDTPSGIGKEIDVTKPSSTSNDLKPSSTTNDPKLSTTRNVPKPSSTSNDRKPSLSSDDRKPSSTSTTTKPSAPNNDIVQIFHDFIKPEILVTPLKPTTTKYRQLSSISTNTKPSALNYYQYYEMVYDSSHPEILEKPQKTTTINKKNKHTSGYVGNGWWSSDSYFGWEPDSYPGLSWGLIPRPTQSGLKTIPPHNEEHTLPNVDKDESNSEESQGLVGLYFDDHDKVNTNLVPEEVAVTVADWIVPVPVHFNDSWGIDYEDTLQGIYVEI